MKRLTTEYTVGVAPTYSMLEHHYKGAERELERVTGTAYTKHGAVVVYAQGFIEKWKPVSRFTFIYGGKRYVREDNRTLTDRGLTKIARRFARDVVAGRVRK